MIEIDGYVVVSRLRTEPNEKRHIIYGPGKETIYEDFRTNSRKVFPSLSEAIGAKNLVSRRGDCEKAHRAKLVLKIAQDIDDEGEVINDESHVVIVRATEEETRIYGRSQVWPRMTRAPYQPVEENEFRTFKRSAMRREQFRDRISEVLGIVTSNEGTDDGIIAIGTMKIWYRD